MHHHASLPPLVALACALLGWAIGCAILHPTLPTLAFRLWRRPVSTQIYSAQPWDPLPSSSLFLLFPNMLPISTFTEMHPDCTISTLVPCRTRSNRWALRHPLLLRLLRHLGAVRTFFVLNWTTIPILALPNGDQSVSKPEVPMTCTIRDL